MDSVAADVGYLEVTSCSATTRHKADMFASAVSILCPVFLVCQSRPSTPPVHNRDWPFSQTHCR